jgi:uncharacterized ferritin-like protein (DUF455 family)
MPGAQGSPSEFQDIDAWAEHYVLSAELKVKMAPPPVPSGFRPAAAPRRLAAPGRPPELRLARRGERTPRAEALKEPHYRARLLHAFWHHELQAAELMCWALLAFSDAEPEFRRGLLGICLDEIRHMNLYREHIEALGSSIGSFGIRDWFWKRVPSCPTKVAFVALMGMGLEAANLEHAPNFAAVLRAAGDETAARIQEQVAREELTHVRFGTRWFTRWTGGCRFEDWLAELPPPMSPWVLKSEPLATRERLSAGMPAEFLQALASYVPSPKGRPLPAAESSE